MGQGTALHMLHDIERIGQRRRRTPLHVDRLVPKRSPPQMICFPTAFRLPAVEGDKSTAMTSPLKAVMPEREFARRGGGKRKSRGVHPKGRNYILG